MKEAVEFLEYTFSLDPHEKERDDQLNYLFQEIHRSISKM